MSRLVQLLGATEELWYFPDDVTDEGIQKLWKDYMDTDFDSFEEYIESLGELAAVAERTYVDEIYV